MLAPRHAALLRRRRSIGLIVLAASGMMIAGIVAAVVAYPSTWVGAIPATLGLVVINLRMPSAVRAEPEPIQPVYDRRVVRADEPLDLDERRRLRVHLALHWTDVDANLTRLGLEPLDAYLELRLDQGIARHDPEVARRSLSSLLELPDTTIDATTRQALELLARDLEDASRCGAGFCLMPIAAWSGLVETNLRLFLG